MFTGLIADLGSVSALDRDDAGARVTIATGLAAELAEGDSIAVNGVCLTAVEVGEDGFVAEAMRETLERSSLGRLIEGAAVNLELPLRAEDRLGGHVVQGHVDGTGRVSEVEEAGFARVLSIELDDGALARYLVEKGSVAVDGVSLTVTALGESGFAVSLIPETLERTTLGGAVPGTEVNIEVDVLAKHVERLLEASGGHNGLASSHASSR
jgi:riboflavin synthase